MTVVVLLIVAFAIVYLALTLVEARDNDYGNGWRRAALALLILVLVYGFARIVTR